MDITTVQTTPYLDQKTGTSGLRKKVSVFRQPNYVENFVQSVLDSLEEIEGKTLVIGGDGRYFNDKAIQSILKMAIANQFGRIIVGQNGLLSTPATSHVIVKYGAIGGFILSASHNPGGPNGDFGIKYDNEHGGPASEEMMMRFYERTKTLDHYWTVKIPNIDLSQIGEQTFGNTVIQVISSVDDYTAYMQQIFDFSEIKALFQDGFKMVFDAMNAATGPYAVHIFEEILGAKKGSVIHATPLPDFGGLHPEPNLTHAHQLVELMYSKNAPDFAAASDGDGDRYMILGKSFFLNPSDSLALLTQYLDKIPFYHGKMTGVARSMPTSFAADSVAKSMGISLYQTPTGWKYFGNLLTAGKVALCGEESFGAGSFHLQEKDGIWAVLCWLTILAKTRKTVAQITQSMWRRHGRVFARLENYEDLEKSAGDALIQNLTDKIKTLTGTQVSGRTITQASVFNYTDPITGEVAKNQALCIELDDCARIVVRLSGTGSNGATLRVYLNEKVSDPALFNQEVGTVLASLSDISRDILEIKRLTGAEKPSMIT